jgi:hypothetical protein
MAAGEALAGAEVEGDAAIAEAGGMVCQHVVAAAVASQLLWRPGSGVTSGQQQLQQQHQEGCLRLLYVR